MTTNTTPRYRWRTVVHACLLALLLLPLRVPAQEPTDELIGLKFEGQSLDQVMGLYSELTELTPLVAPGVNLEKTKINLRSQTKLTVAEALEAIETVLAMNNVGLVPHGEKFVKVVPIATIRTEGMVIRQDRPTEDSPLLDSDDIISQVINLQHLEISELQGVIKGLTHTYAKIQPLERTNGLMITDTAANVNRILEIVGLLDQPVPVREEPIIKRIVHASASDIKKKLEEIISDMSEKTKTKVSTVARPRVAGPPGVIRARPPTAPSAGGVTTETITETEIQRGMISGTVKIVADDRTNILILITRRENMRFFDDIIAALDVETDPDVLTKTFWLEYADTKDVATMLNELIGKASKAKDAPKTPGAAGDTKDTAASATLREYVKSRTEGSTATAGSEKTKLGELSSENIKILSDERTNTLLIMGSKGDIATISEIIKEMDVMLSQVLIEAVILQVGLDDSLTTGFQWVQRALIASDRSSSGTTEPLYSFAGRSGSSGPATTTSMNTPSSVVGLGSGLTYYFTNFGLNLDAVIAATATDTRSEILSAPVILTTDNKKATIEITSQEYFYKGQKYVATSSGAGTYVDDVETQKIGITLTTTPRINKSKYVVMELVQDVEDVATTTKINGQDWPVVASRHMEATVAVNSGETIILGGLVKRDARKGESRVPLLGRIPLLGALFRSRNRTAAQQEVIVFITPYVLDTPEDIARETGRRKGSLQAGELWERGWSNSRLANEPEDVEKDEE